MNIDEKIKSLKDALKHIDDIDAVHVLNKKLEILINEKKELEEELQNINKANSSDNNQTNKSQKKRYHIGGHVPGSRRRSKAEISRLVILTAEALSNGYYGRSVCDYLEQQTGKPIAYSVVATYIRKVMDRWEEEDLLMRPFYRDAQRRRLFELALQIKGQKDPAKFSRERIEIEKLIARIEGNLDPIKIETSDKTILEKFTDQELDDYIKSHGKEVPERLEEEFYGSGPDTLH